jgi:cysteine-rich repeat protein
MRSAIPLLLLLPLGGCFFIAGSFAERCDAAATAASCDGNTLTSCQGDFLIVKDCGATEVCNATLGVCSLCGNAQLDDGEECDDGNTQDGDGCEADCKDAVCGNNITDSNPVDNPGVPEDCDDGAANSDTEPDACREDCSNPSCGDDVQDSGEECDNGNQNSDTIANACREDCRDAACGDNVIDGGAPLNETCDDGNVISDDGCESACVLTFPTCGNTVPREVVNGTNEVCYNQSQLVLDSGITPFSVAAADLNQDFGQEDLIVVNNGDNDLGIFRNIDSTQPTFANNNTMQRVPLGDLANPAIDPVSIAVADLNGGGGPDIATANQGSDNITILLNTSPAAGQIISFASPVVFNAGDSPVFIAAGDVNNGGGVDLVVANVNSNQISVLTNNGSAQFPTRFTFNVDVRPVSLLIADLNGDGKNDIVTANETANSVTVLINNTAGANGTPSFLAGANLAVGQRPVSVAAGDIDNDLDLDLFTANNQSNDVTVLVNNGSGVFTAQANNIQVGRQPRVIFAGDVNHDFGTPAPILDLIIVSQQDNAVSVIRGKGAGEFAPQMVLKVGSGPFAAVICDVKKDTYPDIVTANTIGGDVSVLVFTP